MKNREKHKKWKEEITVAELVGNGNGSFDTGFKRANGHGNRESSSSSRAPEGEGGMVKMREGAIGTTKGIKTQMVLDGGGKNNTSCWLNSGARH